MTSNPDAPTMTMSVPKPVREAGGGTTKKRAWLWPAIGAGVGLLLLVLVIGHFTRKAQDKQAIQTALAGAQEQIDAGDPTAARGILEAARREVRPNAPGLSKLLERLGQVKALEEKEANRAKLTEVLDAARLRIALDKAAEALAMLYQAKTDLPEDTPGMIDLVQLIGKAKDAQIAEKVTARFIEFALAVVNKRFAEATRLVSPESLRKHGQGGIEVRLKIIAGVAQLAQLTRDKVKIKDVHFNEDYTRATLTPEFQIGLEWRSAKNSEWVLEGGQWYVVVE